MPDGFSNKPIPTPSMFFNPVGHCIYCGSEEGLTDEHVIPLSLNGTMILPKSSCRVCAEITSKFERTVSRQMYGQLRAKHGYKTRRKKKRPVSYPLSYVHFSGSTRSLELSLSDYPNAFLIPYLPAPGILTGAPLTETNPEIRLELQASPDQLAQAASLIESEWITFSTPNVFAWGDFCRLLAKIAHGFLIASYGQEGYVPYLPNLILGRSHYLAHYVGGFDEDEGVCGSSHNVSLITLPVDGRCYLAVNIHLMGGIKMPTYQVIAAEVTDFTLLNETILKQNVGNGDDFTSRTLDLYSSFAQA
jgi:hypothetical protein